MYYNKTFFLECNGTYLMGSGEPYHTDEVTEEEFIDTYLTLNGREIRQIAHQPEDIIKHCRMPSKLGVEKCKEVQGRTMSFFTPKYGICYIFNFVGKHENRIGLTSNYGGPQFGLELILDIEGMYH